MLSVKLLPSNSEILKLQYLDVTKIEEVVVVCPSPQKADGVRAQLQLSGLQYDVITISKFIKDCLGTLGEAVPEISRKSELLLKLSTIWKIKYPDLGYDIFTKAFNLYTELRGFTLNLEMLDDVLAEEEENLAMAIKFFWLVSAELNLVDEHESYGFLSNEIRTNESPTHEVIDNKTIVFMGFKHLSGGQLDLLKSVGIRTEVIIPIHEKVFNSADSTSWVGWLETKNENILEKADEIKVNVHRFKKGRFAEEAYTKLNELLEEGSEIYLPSSSQEFKNLNVIPAEGLFYKTSIDPFKPILTSLINELKTLTDFGKVELKTDELVEVLDDVERTSIRKGFFFRWLKVKSQFLALLEDWQGLSEANSVFTFFDAEVFYEILDLDLPRNYLIPLFEKEPERFINSLDTTESSNDGKVVLIGGSFLGSLKGGNSDFSELQLENLTSLGPVRSNELDFVSKKVALEDLALKNELEILLEEGIEEVDIAWLELLEIFDIEDNSLQTKHPVKKNMLVNRKLIDAGPLEKLSSTSLQAYIDCPRKYYFSYIEKIKLEPRIEESLRPFQLGLIEHSVIGKFFKDENTELKDLAAAELNRFLAKEKLSVSSVQYQEALFEIVMLSSRGIKFVKELRDFFGKGEVVFEKEFSVEKDGVIHRGSIDLFYKTDEGHIIIDFKRSGAGIPKVGDFQDFSKIQAWYYLDHIGIPSEELLLLGYLNLKDPSTSLIYSPSKENVGELKKILEDPKAKISHLKDYEDYVAKYSAHEKSIVDSLKIEKGFPAKPLDEKACSYCPVGYVCERGKL